MNDGEELSPEEVIQQLLERVKDLENDVKENQTVIDYALARIIENERILSGREE